MPLFMKDIAFYQFTTNTLIEHYITFINQCCMEVKWFQKLRNLQVLHWILEYRIWSRDVISGNCSSRRLDTKKRSFSHVVWGFSPALEKAEMMSLIQRMTNVIGKESEDGHVASKYNWVKSESLWSPSWKNDEG